VYEYGICGPDLNGTKLSNLVIPTFVWVTFFQLKGLDC